MRTVIIGGGSAGISAATHLRRNDEKAEIIVIERSGEFALSACGLPYLLSGKIKNAEDLTGASAEQMKRIFNIDIRLNTEVLTIEPELKQLILTGGKTLTYDKLVVAAGGLQLRPDIAGVLSDNIFTLNSLYSAQKISDYFYGLEAKYVLVLGGGYIGLRAAEALLQNGAKVTVIDKAAHILSEFDHDFATLAKQKLETKGLKILTGTTVKEFLPDTAVLSNGSRLRYDVAVIATGNKSEVKLPIMADIDIGETGGIVVNEQMMTSVADIFACGDNIEIKDLISNLPARPDSAPPVVRSAKIAADNICGIPSRMNTVLRNQIVKLFDYVLGICGCNEEELKRSGIVYHRLYLTMDNCENYLNSAQKMFMKLLFKTDGLILGFQIMGKAGVDTRLNAVAALMMQNGTVKQMENMPVAYFPEFAKATDAVNVLGSMAYDIITKRLNTADIYDLQENDVLLDVCGQNKFKQFAKGENTVIPLPALRDNLKHLPKNKRIVIACINGYAAYLAYCILRGNGFDNIVLLNSPNIWQ